MRLNTFVSTLAFALAVPVSVQAAGIFNDNFDVDTSANYNVNTVAGSNQAATFAYDYGTVGVPSAPNSGGTTRGLKLEANYLNSNDATEIFSGMSVSPKNFSVTGDFDVMFDLWQNSIGPFTGMNQDGGSGSTQVTDYGWGTAGTSAQWAGGRDSIVFGTTGEGNSGSDWRVYPNSGTIPTTSPPYVAVPGAGNDASVQNNIHSYYVSNFPGQAPPVAQQLLFPVSQTNVAPQNGTTAFKWHAVKLSKRGNTLTWTMDGVPIANVDLTGVGALGGNNIFFGQSDINATASADANARSLLFGLVDNVMVIQIPEPASAVLCAFVALAGLCLRRR
jgi:hypothetical protein